MGEMSKVEEVARAIATALQKSDRSAHVEPRPGDEAITVIDGMFDLKAVAKAAIEAMRVPTEAMIDAGTAARWQSAVRDANSIREIWNAGIDAALKE